MRSKREIRDRLKQASFRYLKEILSEKLKKAPQNCRHNESVSIDASQELSLGMCTLTAETKVRVCDARVPGCAAAAGCNWFDHKQSKEAIKGEWSDMLKDAQGGGRRALVRKGYGDLASLLWALDDEGEVEALSEPEDVDDDPGDGEESDGDEDEDPVVESNPYPKLTERLPDGDLPIYESTTGPEPEVPPEALGKVTRAPMKAPIGGLFDLEVEKAPPIMGGHFAPGVPGKPEPEPEPQPLGPLIGEPEPGRDMDRIIGQAGFPDKIAELTNPDPFFAEELALVPQGPTPGWWSRLKRFLK
jgi:hypothetical protein